MKRLLWSVFALLAVLGLARLRFDAEVLNLLPAELPAVEGLRLHQQYFANARELLVTLAGDDPEQLATAAEAIADRLNSVTNLVRRARWQPPWLEHPGDTAENLAWLWLQQPPAELSALRARLETSALAQALAETRETLATALDPQTLARASYDPLGLSQLPGNDGAAGTGFDQGTGIFTGADGTFRVVFVEPANPGMNYRAAATWLAAVQTNVTAALAAEPLRIQHTGGPAFLAEIAQGMERDLRNSVLGTLVVIAGLFWLAHRSWRPLGWLVAALGLTLLGTLALGGLLFGTLNVVSAGFAAVLLGLAVDYGLVAYQEAAAAPGEAPDHLRRHLGRSIGWSAATTAAAFVVLNFAGLPGLAELGSLTALGVVFGALVMLFFYLPRVRGISPAADSPGPPEKPLPSAPHDFPRRIPIVLTTVALMGIVGLILGGRGLPKISADTEALRPRGSPAYAAMDEMRARLGRTNEPAWLLFRGTNHTAVARQLAIATSTLAAQQTAGSIRSFRLPTGFWPHPDNAIANQATVRTLAARLPEIEAAVTAAGFTTNSLALARAVFARWLAGATTTNGWPANDTARWLNSQFAAQTEAGEWLALGFADPVAPDWEPGFDSATAPLVSSWGRLGGQLLSHVEEHVGWLTAVLALLVVGALGLAFRRLVPVLLSLLTGGTALALLLAVMSLAGWQWNLLNLVALPLLLGTGVDYTIHVQLALQRDAGNLRAFWRSTGRALLLCAATTVTGFGSLAWSSNAGLASLGAVCATGIACVAVVGLGFLPSWWRAAVVRRPGDSGGLRGPHFPTVAGGTLGESGSSSDESSRASRLYQTGLWRLCLKLVVLLPGRTTGMLAAGIARAYCLLNPRRVAVVAENLRPLFPEAPATVAGLARENVREFARKLVDLWRHEAGVDFSGRVQPGDGWEHFHAALASRRGVLLVTPHLGNWELGVTLLRRFGVQPLVLTAPEPAGGLTELRAAARRRLGIETLVVGDDPFAFVPVIRQLQEGGVVALLVDRPPAASAVTVEFCGRPFAASVAPAELARATGCVVLPVCIVRQGTDYTALALPAVDYDRAALGSRDARREFAGRILRAFGPSIRQFAAQWFHFVPVWRSSQPSAGARTVTSA